MGKSLFICFEHLDGAGGSTQIKMLDDWLWENTKLDISIGAEPTNNATGKLIRKVLKKEIDIREQDVITGLFIADRNEHVNEINDFLGNGYSVYLCDRYFYSNMAYNSYDDLGMERIEKMNSFFRKPDLCFYIDVTPENAMSRIEKRGEEKELFETLGYLRTVKERYDKICDSGKMIRIDGNRSPEEIFNDIIEYVKKALN